jgi:hypothetical protein
LEELGADGKVVLKCFLNKRNWRVLIVLIWLRIG